MQRGLASGTLLFNDAPESPQMRREPPRILLHLRVWLIGSGPDILRLCSCAERIASGCS
jgi:hypothetical protein